MDRALERAKVLQDRKLFGAALRELEKARRDASREARPIHLLRALNRSFVCADGLRLSEEAMLFSEMGLDVAAQVGASDPASCGAYFNFALAAAKAGRFDKSLWALGLLESTASKGVGEFPAHARLLKLVVLVDSGEFEGAEEYAARVSEDHLDAGRIVVLEQARAVLAMESGRPEEAAALLEEALEGSRRLWMGAAELSILEDLGQAYAMLSDPEGVARAVERAQKVLIASPCALDALEIGRLAALGAFGMALTGQLRELRRRIGQVTSLLSELGRPREAARLARRIIQFSSRHAGFLYDLQSPAQPIFSFFESPYVIRHRFSEASVAPLTVYVRDVGPALATGLDESIIQQAATVPFSDESRRVQDLALGPTDLADCPSEAKVLAVLRDYASGCAQEPYQRVLEQLGGQTRRYDPDIVNALVALHDV